MRRKYEDSILCKMRERLITMESGVLLRTDFANLGSYRQVTRGLSALVSNQELVKIGFGIYAKATTSKFSGKLMVAGNPEIVLRQALDRLGIRWEPSRAETAYNIGESTQVPFYNAVRLKDRLRRTIGFNNYNLIFEDHVNAK